MQEEILKKDDRVKFHVLTKKCQEIDSLTLIILVQLLLTRDACSQVVNISTNKLVEFH